VVPVGIFLVEHFYTNSYAMFGAEVYNEKVRFLTSLPYVILVEILGIGIPIAFHAALGIVIWRTSRGNVPGYPYARNWMYMLQRISGVFLLLFISLHVYKARLSGAAPDEMFQHMAAYLDPAVSAANWAWIAFYAAGVVAASFHLGNGLFTFGITWGLFRGVASQRWASRACIAIFVVMSIAGLNSLRSFSGHGIQIFNHPHAVSTR
jgi:succinate dehydrogenase / fumarate reductase cytochrome b subunit